MTLTLLDYAKREHDFEIGDLNDIRYIDIIIISGDEIANIKYKNGKKKTFDSSNSRFMDFYGGSYTLYDDLCENHFELFDKRHKPYDMLEWMDEV